MAMRFSARMCSGTAAKLRNSVTDLRWPGSRMRVRVELRQVVRVDMRRCPVEIAQFAQFLGRHHDLVRSAPAENDDPLELGGTERFERMADDVAAFELAIGLGEDPRDVERDVAHADDHRGLAREIGIEIRELRVPVIPADEGRAAENIAQIVARYVEIAVVRGAGGEHDRIVEPGQLGYRHVPPDGDIADEADILGQRGLLVAAGNALDRLVVGRDAGADQAVGNGEAVEHVDPDVVAEGLLCRFGGVVPGRTGSDNGDVAHGAPPRRELIRAVPHCKAGLRNSPLWRSDRLTVFQSEARMRAAWIGPSNLHVAR